MKFTEKMTNKLNELLEKNYDAERVIRKLRKKWITQN